MFSEPGFFFIRIPQDVIYLFGDTRVIVEDIAIFFQFFETQSYVIIFGPIMVYVLRFKRTDIDTDMIMI